MANVTTDGILKSSIPDRRDNLAERYDANIDLILQAAAQVFSEKLYASRSYYRHAGVITLRGDVGQAVVISSLISDFWWRRGELNRHRNQNSYNVKVLDSPTKSCTSYPRVD
jgi:hypothetical protein